VAQVRNELVRLIDQALGDDPRVALGAVWQLQQDMVWLEQRAVMHARANGYDWGRIGRALGTSRQAARQRFGSLTLMMPPLVRARDRANRQDRDVTKLRNQIAEGRYGAAGESEDPVFW